MQQITCGDGELDQESQLIGFAGLGPALNRPLDQEAGDRQAGNQNHQQQPAAQPQANPAHQELLEEP